MTARARVLRDVRTPVLVGASLAAATVLVALRDPHRGGYGVCPILALTGVYCAGCGGLRAAHDLVNGDVAGAWSMNPMLTVAMPVLALVWATWTFRAATGRQPWHPPTWLWIAIGAVVLAFTVLRNIPALQGWLAPV